MNQPTSQLGQGSPGQFKMPPLNMQPQPGSSNMYNAQMNAAYYQYPGAYGHSEQWVMSNPAYYYNSWAYPPPPNTPPASLMATPPPSASLMATPPPLPAPSGQLPPNFNPGQPPPPLPKNQPMPAKQPPPPPDSPTRRGRCVYPRGGRNVFKGSNRQNSGNQQKNQNNSTQETKRIQNENGENADSHQVQIHKKPKRKPMSSRYTRKRAWCREDAEKVLELENQSSVSAPMLVIHFPDPDLNSHIVRGFSPEIESVHFQIPYKARLCYVKLKQGADMKKVCEEISKIPFGAGFLRAEEKHVKQQNQVTSPEGIDPYTLYVGNLPPHITVAEIKDKFPTATYIDVGFAQKMKYTRYAFIQYATVEEAMEAYKNTINLMLDKRNLIVRFRRAKGNIGLPGDPMLQSPVEKKSKKMPDAADDECEIINDQQLFPKKSIPTEKSATDVDSKDNVLKEAAQMIRNLLEKESESLESGDTPSEQHSPLPLGGPIVNIKSEKEDSNDYPDYDDENDLMGTQIKDEPLDDFLDDYYPDINEEDDDEILPEERDNGLDSVGNLSFLNGSKNNDNIFDDNDSDDDEGYGPKDWEQIRQKELEEKEDKPDISLLPCTKPSISSSFSPLKILPQEKHTSKNDDLDDLFNAMNPESDFDDDL